MKIIKHKKKVEKKCRNQNLRGENKRFKKFSDVN